jgi:hypothetical protein
MLWELIQTYSKPEKKDALKHAVTMLEAVRIQTASFLLEVEQSNGKPRVSVLDALKTHSDVWQRIGFMCLLDFFDGHSVKTNEIHAAAVGGMLGSEVISLNRSQRAQCLVPRPNASIELLRQTSPNHS